MTDGAFGRPSDIMTPVPDETLVRLSEIQAMRSITDALDRIGKTVDRQGMHLSKVDDTLSDMRATLAEMRAEKELLREVRGEVTKLSDRVDVMEKLHVEQKTWLKAGRFITSAIPWLLGICGVVYGFIGSKHS